MSDVNEIPGQVDVVIVGAGLAGLACAFCLQEANARPKVIVLEARERIGGRVFSVEHNDVLFECGAYKINTNIKKRGNTLGVLRKAKLHSLFLKSKWNTEGRVYIADEGEITRNNLKKARNLAKHLMHGILRRQQELPWGEDESLEQSIKRMVNIIREKRMGSSSQRTKFEEELLEAATQLLYAELVVEQGVDGELVSLRNLHPKKKKEELFIKSGTFKLIEFLSHNIDIRTNCEVKSIQRTENGDCVVTTNFEHKITCKKCIVTVPISILQGGILFQPPLPESTVHAIQSFRMADQKLVWLHFETMFWPLTSPSIPFILIGKKGICFYDFSAVYEKPLLLAVGVGETARGWEEIGQDGAVDEVMSCLRKMYPTSFNTQVVRLLYYFVSGWVWDRFAGGARTYCAVGRDLRQATTELISWGKRTKKSKSKTTREEAENSSLYFAGDAIVEHEDLVGTVEGAISSGIRAALQAETTATNPFKKSGMVGKAEDFLDTFSSVIQGLGNVLSSLSNLG